MKSYRLALLAALCAGAALAATPPVSGSRSGVGAAAALPAPAPADTLRPPAGPQADPAPPLMPDTADSNQVSIGLPAILEREPGVNDPVFSILTRLVTSGIYGTITQERLRQEIARLGGESRLPYESVVSITRQPVQPGRTALIRVEFKEPIDLPVPYSILGYHPGSFTASQSCLFREWELGTVHLSEAEKKGDRTEVRTIDLDDVHLFAAVEGDVKIDIDALVDAVLGGAIDDTDVTTLMLCRWRGEWYGAAMGYGKDRHGRSGILSLRRDKILFPTPDGLKGVGRQMRTKAEHLGKVWDAEGARQVGLARPPIPGEYQASP